jgi:hypothetical protein
VIETTPAVKSQSTSVVPGNDTTPRSVVQVPMSDGEPTDLGGEVSVSVSILPAASVVAGEEEESDEHEESGHKI